MVTPSAREHILCATFNQDHSHLAVGTTHGWNIFQLSPFFSSCTEGTSALGVSQIQMLFSSSLIALAGHGEHASDGSRRLRLWNISSSSPVFELPFATPVLRVLMNRTRLLVVLEHATYVFELSTMRMLHTLETVANPRGLAALSSSADVSICAVLPTASAGATGRVLCFDAAHGHALSSLAAHDSSIAALTLSADGSLLATASTKGTVVRVHSVPGFVLLHTFRRGTRPAVIHSLSFSCAAADSSVDVETTETRNDSAELGSADRGQSSAIGGGLGTGTIGGSASKGRRKSSRSLRGLLLCASSNTGTVHVWALDSHSVSRRHASQTSAGSLGGAASGHAGGNHGDGSDGSQRSNSIDSGALGESLPSATVGTAAFTRQGGPMGGLQSWVSRQAASAQAGRDVAKVRVKLGNSSWCSAAVRCGSEDGSEIKLYVITELGALYIFGINALTGASVLQDERRVFSQERALGP